MRLKKMIGVILATAICLTSSVTAFAAGLSAEEKLLLDKLKAGVEVDGTVVKVPAEFLTQAENELKKNGTDITADQAAIVSKKMDEVLAVAQANNVKSIADMKAIASEVLPLVEEAATAVGYTVAYDAAASNFSVTDPNGETVFSTKDVINQTGFDMTTTAAVGGSLVVLLAACVVVANKKKLFAKTIEA